MWSVRGADRLLTRPTGRLFNLPRMISTKIYLLRTLPWRACSDRTQGRAYAEIPGYTKGETDDIYAELLRLLSTPMLIGSHYEGTSTNDVTFFIIHTTFDRCAEHEGASGAGRPKLIPVVSDLLSICAIFWDLATDFALNAD